MVVFCLVSVFGSGCLFVLFVCFVCVFSVGIVTALGLCTDPTSAQLLKPIFVKMDDVFALIN